MKWIKSYLQCVEREKNMTKTTLSLIDKYDKNNFKSNRPSCMGHPPETSNLSYPNSCLVVVNVCVFVQTPRWVFYICLLHHLADFLVVVGPLFTEQNTSELDNKISVGVCLSVCLCAKHYIVADILNVQNFTQPDFRWKKIYAKKSVI